jgi:hypothetical protein
MDVPSLTQLQEVFRVGTQERATSRIGTSTSPDSAEPAASQTYLSHSLSAPVPHWHNAARMLSADSHRIVAYCSIRSALL